MKPKILIVDDEKPLRDTLARWFRPSYECLVAPDAGMLIEPTIGIGGIALVLGICLFIGLVFSSGPAHRAARIDAAEALRGR